MKQYNRSMEINRQYMGVFVGFIASEMGYRHQDRL